MFLSVRCSVVEPVEPVRGDFLAAFGNKRAHQLLPCRFAREHAGHDLAHGILLCNAFNRALCNAVHERPCVALAAADAFIDRIRGDLRAHHPVHRFGNRALRRLAGESGCAHQPHGYGHVNCAVQRRRSGLIQKLPRRPHVLHDAAADAGGNMRRPVERTVDVRRQPFVFVPAKPLRQDAPEGFQVAKRLERSRCRADNRGEDRRSLAEVLRVLHARRVGFIVLQPLLILGKPPDLVLRVALFQQLLHDLVARCDPAAAVRSNGKRRQLVILPQKRPCLFVHAGKPVLRVRNDALLRRRCLPGFQFRQPFLHGRNVRSLSGVHPLLVGHLIQLRIVNLRLQLINLPGKLLRRPSLSARSPAPPDTRGPTAACR